MLTYEKVEAYWRSIVSVYELIQKFTAQGYRNIVIPSRGVCPIYMATQTYHYQNMQYECSIFTKLEERLEWKATTFRESQSGQIWLPFTAQTGNQEEDENTYQIRLNWCKVLKSIISHENSINSTAYHVLTDTIGKEYGHTRSRVIREAPVLLIDTVVSGRAATEIAQALEEVGLTNYKMILAVDAKGSKLNKEYKSQLLNKYSDRVELAYFDDLFTEDQGPIYTNIFGIIYPNLTRALREEFSDPSIAVGSLHMENGRDVLCKVDRLKLDKHKQNLPRSSHSYIDKTQFKCDRCQELGFAYNRARSIFSQLLFNFGLDKFCEHNLSDNNLYLVSVLNEMLGRYNYLDTSTTLDLFERTTPLNMETSNNVSSSHVVRCDLKMNDIETILKKIKSNKIKYKDQYR
ncbi:MAG TPA: hypothetical protein V6D29_10085 [Leptolyngbyaceae cyanobacterium]